MSTILQHPRHLCALGGQQSVVAIPRAIPILHAGPGCGFKLHTGLGSYNGFQGGCYSGGAALVGSNVGEKEIVFGGEQRLRDVIDGALKVMDGDLYVVLSGCATDLVGDDTENVVTEYRRQGAPIVYAATGGFRGSNLHGHETIVNAIVDQFLTPQERIPGLINVWSTVPYYDPFWAGNLTAIQNLLAGLGLRANLLFGPDSDGIESWRRVPAAELNLVVSSWTGLSTAQLLNERYGTPWLHWPTLPIGAEETSRFVRAVADAARVDDKVTQAFLDRQEKRYHYYFERAADFFLEFRWDLPSHYVTVTDAFYGSGISRLLSGELGLLPSCHFITDQPPTEQHDAIQQQFAVLSPELEAPVTFTADGDQITAELRENSDSAPLILGSAWERDITAELGGCHLSIASPMMDRLVANGSYFGYDGALRLIEDVYSSILGVVQ